ncbi:replication initiator protein A [Chromobacterium violaceum]|uniref:RepA n=1 Tax=Chromobacterium violaceum TaxID=536 RepID=A0A2R4K2J4_CHRVL|nr:replication initiator protein A [Chromobacterium violaceum]AVV48114.1 RepA [Chromobacterium violaceum]
MSDLFVQEDEQPEQNPLLTQLQAISQKAKQRRSESSIAPIKNPQRDFFVADFVDYTFKDDVATMDAPFFSLSTKTDRNIFRWESPDARRYVEVAPSAFGRATMLDKDVLIFLASQVTAARNAGAEISRTVRFVAHDFLVSTNRDTSRNGYKGLKDALTRLRGTTIRTNIRTGDREITHIFGLIESAQIIAAERSGRMSAVEVTLSEWLWRALASFEVLSIDEAYFRLNKPLERRLYEIARKHVGRQSKWQISLEALWKKSGSLSPLKKFKHQLKQSIADDVLPGYRYRLNADDSVSCFPKNNAPAVDELTRRLVQP